MNWYVCNNNRTALYEFILFARLYSHFSSLEDYSEIGLMRFVCAGGCYASPVACKRLGYFGFTLTQFYVEVSSFDPGAPRGAEWQGRGRPPDFRVSAVSLPQTLQPPGCRVVVLLTRLQHACYGVFFARD